jgi:hypothetical protein
VITPVLALLAALAPVQEARSPLESGLVRAVELESPPGTFVQHFRLESPAARAGEVAGLARYLSGPDPEGGLRVELELEYFAGEVRVIQSERASLTGRRLVFREVRLDGGRTLFLTGSPTAGYECQELAGGEALRRTFEDAGEFPLLIVEAARRGLALPTEARVFEPLAGQPEPSAIALLDDRLVLSRADGSVRFATRFADGAPVEWTWNDRAPVARAITREEYGSLRAARPAPSGATAGQ